MEYCQSISGQDNQQAIIGIQIHTRFNQIGTIGMIHREFLLDDIKMKGIKTVLMLTQPGQGIAELIIYNIGRGIKIFGHVHIQL